jgi:hypothetical protein
VLPPHIKKELAMLVTDERSAEPPDDGRRAELAEAELKEHHWRSGAAEGYRCC